MRSADEVLTLRMSEGAAGYGVYCMLLELLRDAENRELALNAKNLAFALNIPDVDLVDRVIHSPGLFDLSKEGRFSSPWLNLVLQEFDAKRAAAQEAGRRGAAARYAKRDNFQQPYSNPMGGAMATPQTPQSNTPIHNKKENEKNSSTQEIDGSRSSLLGMSWGGYDGAFLYDLSKKPGTPITPIDIETIRNMCAEARARGVTDRNPEAVLDLCLALGLNSEMLSFLLKLTNGGAVGTPIMKEMIHIEWAATGKEGKQKFIPKYPAAYVLTKLVPLAQ